MTASIWALPGFLGSPSDWNCLGMKEIKGVDTLSLSGSSLTEWGVAINNRATQCQPQPNVLMGYSLGGRLALHALLEFPGLWSAAVVVSAHPGFTSAVERKERKERDLRWAKRFEEEEWTSLMQSWNRQEAFSCDSFQFDRKEEGYKRESLSNQLIQGSLGAQEDLCHSIKKLQVPLLWVTGLLDVRYCLMARGLEFSHPLSRKVEVAQAGHRVPWEQPEAFKQLLREFVTSLTIF
jgi:2-succinyl-6-hydroxy-2,4-cyclohexadiene-1-carboxylate synthase